MDYQSNAFRIFLQGLDFEEKRRYRKLEKCSLKLVDATCALAFNSNCIRERLCPKSLLRSGRAWTSWTDVERLLRRREKETKERLQHLEEEKQQLWEDFSAVTSREIQQNTREFLGEAARKHQRVVITRHEKKLTILHGGPVRNEEHRDGYVNLAGTNLTESQKTLLNLGLQCHYMRKPHPESKRIETEILVDRLQRLQQENKIDLTPTVIDELVGEAGRQRNTFSSRILSQPLRKAAKELREREDIIIRKGDKSAVYVIMKRDEYLMKMDNILNDPTKFVRLQKDPTEALKKRVSSMVTRANNLQQEIKFPKIIGDFGPGYCYGTVKTHKPDNPLRPIISQMTSPTYKIAKTLNNILTPFIPTGYSLKSSVEFIDILRTTEPDEDISSLDVESLFTNVPVLETIEIILNNVYRSGQNPIPIPEKLLKEMLTACTTEAPFLSHRGELFRQVDGVAMGSPLGVLFANMYMAAVEKKTFSDHQRPRIYARYVDDIFIAIRESDDPKKLAYALKSNSVLNFTIEKSIDKTLPFLDVFVERKTDHYATSVFTKATNVGRCLNARGECPDSYKRSVIGAYVRRALSHCNKWADVHTELERVRQMLTNNGYSSNIIEDVINKKMDEFYTQASTNEDNEERSITIYHKMDYGTAYRQEAGALRRIISEGVTPKAPYEKVSLRVFSRPNLVASLIMKNSTAPTVQKESKTGVVYKFRCPEEVCKPLDSSYVGHTMTTLRRRLQAHRNNGAIHQHFIDVHDKKPPLEELIENTDIIHRENNYGRLVIAEAVSINQQKPTLNVQISSEYVLPSNRRTITIHRDRCSQHRNVQNNGM